MESSLGGKIKLYFDFLPEKTKKALDFLSKEKWLEQSDWYLAGGTALSLQAGHRKSVDLDFFIKEKQFNNNELLGRLSLSGKLEVDINKDNTVYARLFDAKVSFISYPFFIPKQNFVRYGAVKMIQPLDIAVMKIVAISQRGKKRDFFDLYWCVKNIDSLENIIKRLAEQYPLIGHDYHHIIKSLAYFDDAEGDPDPDIYFKANWKEVKEFFKREAAALFKTLIFS